MPDKKTILGLVLSAALLLQACGVSPSTAEDSSLPDPAETEALSEAPTQAPVGTDTGLENARILAPVGAGQRTIPLEKELAPLIAQLASDEGERLEYPDEPKGYVGETGLFWIETGEGVLLRVSQSLDGVYAVRGRIRDEEAIAPLMQKLQTELGMDPYLSLRDMQGVLSFELLDGSGTALFETEDPALCGALEELLGEYMGADAPKTPSYDLELRIRLGEGEIVSLCLDTEEGALFLPPLRHYRFHTLNPAKNTGWLELLSWDAWPEELPEFSPEAAARLMLNMG